MNSIANKIRDHGWRQGSYLPNDLINYLRENYLISSPVELPDEEGLYILISHDCDINYIGSINNEPICEILFARKIKKPESNKRHGKSSRYFQFFDLDSSCYEIWSAHRYFIPRDSLQNHSPSGSLDKENLRHLTYWMRSRYNRGAFPDAFNERLRAKSSEIENCLIEKSEYVTDFYLRVSNDELEDLSKPYEIIGLALMDDENYGNNDLRSQCIDLLEELTEIFKSINIKFLEPFTLASDEEVSIASIRRMTSWSFDAISFDQGNEDPLRRVE